METQISVVRESNSVYMGQLAMEWNGKKAPSHAEFTCTIMNWRRTQSQEVEFHGQLESSKPSSKLMK
jgi:hypothetical protein